MHFSLRTPFWTQYSIIKNVIKETTWKLVSETLT